MLLVLLGSALALAAPAELVPGQLYAGGQQVGVAALGLALTVPAGWTGGLPVGGEALVLGSTTEAGMVLVQALPDTSLQALTVELGQAQPVDQGLVLVPTAAPQVAGDRVRASYQGTSGGQAVVASAEAVVGAGGTAVLVLALGPEASAEAYRAVTRQLADSVVITTPQRPAAGAASGDFASLRGRKLHYLKSSGASVSGGYSDEQQVWLCSDGSFQSSEEHTALSGSLSYADAGSGAGTWAIAGPQLTLSWRDGSTSTHQLAWVEGKLHVDGARWFVVDNDRCP